MEAKRTIIKYRSDLDYMKKNNYYGYDIINERNYNIITYSIILSNIYFIILGENVIRDMILGYCVGNLYFQTLHMTTHTAFLEHGVEHLAHGVGLYVAYIHHYDKPNLLSTFWLEQRIAFFTDAPTVPFLWIPFIILNTNCLPIYSYHLGIQLLHGPTHEWYHLTQKERNNHFNYPLNQFLIFLNWVGVINERTHQKHHMHNKNNIEKVINFNDMEIPFTELFNYIWDFIYYLKIKTQIRSFQYIMCVVLHLLLCLSFQYYITTIV